MIHVKIGEGSMVTTASMAEVAALVGEPARAAMLQAMMDGRALTATELASVAGITPQTASFHLGRLCASSLVGVLQQGRHRYHRLATPQVAQMLESVMLVAAGTLTPRTRTGPRDEALRAARTCYDHIAGRLGVGIADAMTREGWVETDDDAAMLTERGGAFLAKLGVDLNRAPEKRKTRALPLCRICLDWSERRPHFSGLLGSELCRHSLASGWLRKLPGSRALEVTPEGKRVFRDVFQVRTVHEPELAQAGD
jgi:DNA-binding transcriptional ArsR family regulator